MLALNCTFSILCCNKVIHSLQDRGGGGGGGLLCYSLCDSDSVTLAAVTLSLSPDLLRNQQLQLAILLALLLLLLLTHHTPARLRQSGNGAPPTPWLEAGVRYLAGAGLICGEGGLLCVYLSVVWLISAEWEPLSRYVGHHW